MNRTKPPKPNFWIELIWSMGAVMLRGIELLIVYVVLVTSFEAVSWHSVDFQADA